MFQFMRLAYYAGGGARGLAWIIGGFSAASVTIAVFGYRAWGPQGAMQVTVIWGGVMMALQALFMLGIGPGAIRRSIQKDFESKLIESHRLTPMSDLNIALGYLFGTPLQLNLLAITCALFSLVLFSIAANHYGRPEYVGLFVGVQIGLFCLSYMTGTIVLSTGLVSAGKAPLITIAVVFGIFGTWIVPALPAVLLLTPVHTAFLIRGYMQFGEALPLSVPLSSMALQLAIGTTLFFAAMRAVRGTSGAMFSRTLGLALLGILTLASVLGAMYQTAHTLEFFEQPFGESGTVIVTTAMLIFAAHIPLMAAARLQMLGDRRAVLSERSVNWGPLLATGFLSAILIGSFVFATTNLTFPRGLGALNHPGWALLTPVMLALVLSCLADGLLFRWTTMAPRGAVWVAVGVFAVLKLMPLIVDAILAEVTIDTEFAYEGGYIAALSPLGVVIATEYGQPNAAWIGVVMQGVLLAVIAGLVGYRVRANLRAFSAAAAPPPVARAATAPPTADQQVEDA